MRPKCALAHTVEHRVAHVETGSQVGLNHLVPLLEVHLVHGAVARYARVINQHFDRSDIAFDFCYLGLASLVIADIELVGRDTGIRSKLVRLFFVARVGCDHGITGILQCHADGFADATATACY